MERVSGMPIRFVAIKKFVFTREDGKIFEFLPGEVYENTLDSFNFISENFPGYVQEIEMTIEDWIDLATKRALDCKKRISELERLYGDHLETYYYRVIPSTDDERVDGTGYAGGLRDAYNKVRMLEEDIDIFDREHAESLTNASNGMHR